MSELEYVTEENFETEVLAWERPVLVDFTAVWCGPCKMVDPIVTKLGEEWDGKIKVVKMDADKNPNIVQKYGILGIPALLLFYQGEVRERINGYQPRKKLVKKLEKYLEI